MISKVSRVRVARSELNRLRAELTSQLTTFNTTLCTIKSRHSDLQLVSDMLLARGADPNWIQDKEISQQSIVFRA